MIYLECYTDEALVKALGIHKKEIYHSFGKSNVCKRLEKSRNSKGLVDEDPGRTQPPYIGKMIIKSNEDDIKLLYDNDTNNNLIVLNPKLEEWILKSAKEVGVNMEDYSLPEDADELHKVIATKNPPKEFVHLIEDIKKRSKMLRALEKLIKT